MAEINGNIHNYKIDKIVTNKKGTKQQKEQAPSIQEEKSDYIADTGVLGRSQVINVKGGNTSQSVDDAVLLAIKNPIILKGSDEVFERIYNNFINSGMKEEEAYTAAAMATADFIEIAKARSIKN